MGNPKNTALAGGRKVPKVPGHTSTMNTPHSSSSSSTAPLAGGKLAGKIALITGGTSGIGLATAKRFVAEGAHVFITGRRQANLDEAVRELGPEHVTALQGDSAQLADLDRIFAVVREQRSRLDVVFANAGIGSFSPLGQISEEHFDSIYNTNVKGVVFTVQGALPLMGGGGTIILNASIAGVKGTPAFSIYSSTKAAVRNLARSWALDLKGRGIRVNVVSPGLVPTPAYDTFGLTEEQKQNFIAAGVAAIPQGRAGTPDDIAKSVVFLASEDSSYVNAVELFVDGGAAQV